MSFSSLKSHFIEECLWENSTHATSERFIVEYGADAASEETECSLMTQEHDFKNIQVNSGPLQMSHSAKINTAAFSPPDTYVHIWQRTFCKQAGLPAKSYVGCLPAEVSAKDEHMY